MDILHCDLNNFYASVEQSLDPDLKGKYVAVSGNPATRSGIILAKNTAAKQMGVKTGEAIWQAKQKCPDLVCVPPHFEYYAHFSRRVRAIYEQYTDKVEGFGLDECWLDVTHSKIFGTPFQIAEKIRKEVREKTVLTISVGVSFNKTFAKLGSDLKKPDATTVISKENFRQVVWPLDVSEMLFVGSHTKQKLNEMGIYTLGELANAPLEPLKKRFGVVGERLKTCANGEDCDVVRNADTERDVKSVGHGTTTLRDMTSYKDAETVLSVLSEMVATRLRRYGFCGSVVHLDVRRNDLTHECKQTTVH
ncbi:MAG: DNA polymerase IV, partial [Candidatus Fimimonas sp.]